MQIEGGNRSPPAGVKPPPHLPSLFHGPHILFRSERRAKGNQKVMERVAGGPACHPNRKQGAGRARKSRTVGRSIIRFEMNPQGGSPQQSRRRTGGSLEVCPAFFVGESSRERARAKNAGAATAPAATVAATSRRAATTSNGKKATQKQHLACFGPGPPHARDPQEKARRDAAFRSNRSIDTSESRRSKAVAAISICPLIGQAGRQQK